MLLQLIKPALNAGKASYLLQSTVQVARPLVQRSYATAKKKKPLQDISQVPVKAVGVLADYYVPPKITSCPVTSWHKLLLRRCGAFGLNTFSVSKFKTDTKMKLKFNDWKETAVEQYVKTNKIFAAACSLPKSQRQSYIQTQLNGIAGLEVTAALASRVASFPQGLKMEWTLVSVESNPKLVSFNAIPDANDVTSMVQFVVQVKTKQALTITGKAATEPEKTEKVVTDYIVMTMNPITDEMAFVGTLFESDHLRPVKPELDMLNRKAMEAFVETCADIYRAPPVNKK